ncbi:ArsR/SmtB family transcription factor [Streptomyces caeni]|uniref:ArsR/SmtB family transcription factor n=1 Tax=Streptomyces caeni TaxID=2307231 RepID=A0ABW4IRE9_9ACTN
MAQIDPAGISELHARVCKALADPTRLLLINELRDGARSVGEVAEALEIPQPNASRHLSILRDRGVVTIERVGSNSFYRLSSDKVLAAVDLLREFMTEELGWRDGAHQEPGPELKPIR